MVSESYKEGTPLMWLCGDSDRVRLLSVFVDEWGTAISRCELARRTDVTRASVDDHLDDFVGIGLVEQTARSGHSRWYRLDEESPVAEHLYQLDNSTLQALLEQDGHSEPNPSESSPHPPTKHVGPQRRHHHPK